MAIKDSIILLASILLMALSAGAQITSFSYTDNSYDPVYEVEEMYPAEIKAYNQFVEQGMSQKDAIAYINGARAQYNLIDAPATIIEYTFVSELKEEDSIPGAEGAVGVWVYLINSTPKTIKDITLEFEFEYDYTQVYDIKSGDKYLVVKFSNLEGRTTSNQYSDIMANLTSCFHLLDLNKATYRKLFYNKKADTARLHSAKIVYTDGSTSNKIAVFNGGYTGDKSLYFDGPLSPITKYMKRLN